MKKFPSVSIIFPTFNGYEDTEACLKSIHALNYPQTKLDVIVIDNHSTDGTPEKLSKYFPEVKLLTQPENLGFSKSVNLGAKHSLSEFLFIANNDVTLPPDFLKNLVSFAQQHPHFGALGSLIYSRKNQERLVSSGYHYNFWTGKISSAKVSTKPYRVVWVQGCGLLTPSSVFKKLGGFATEFSFYFEDADYCLRARKRGYQSFIVPSAAMYHSEGATINKKTSVYKLEKWYTNKFLFIKKHASPLQLLLSIILQLLLISPIKTITQHQPYLPVLKSFFKIFIASKSSQLSSQQLS